MSGIVAVVTFDGRRVERDMVASMARAADHRGQDGTEYWLGAGAGLGYQRTRVLSCQADERGLATVGDLVCVADARLDNRDELLTALHQSAWLPDRPSDAEILLAAFERWGPDSAAKLIGDFAFVVWDSRRRRLFAGRDPMAMRSIAYYVHPGRMIAMATEVKQLLALPGVPIRLHETAVLADLAGTHGQAEWTFYEGIANVAPAHLVCADQVGAQTRRFWRVDPSFRLWFEDEEHYADMLQRRLIEAVGARLRTDRPAGIFLSGGVDSGSVAAAGGSLVGRRAVPTPALHAFSWAFESFPQCDEREVAHLIAAEHHLQATDVPADDGGPLAGYPEHGPDRDDPFLGAFQPLIEHGLLAARAAGVGVVLGGDRGDLAIGSTGWSYLRLLQARQWADLRAELTEHRRVTADGWGRILRRHFVGAMIGRLRRRSARQWLGRVTRGTDGDPDAGSAPWLLGAAASYVASGEPPPPHGLGFSRKLRHEYILLPLHIRGMAWSERTYARHGLTFADPFSDRRLVEAAIAMPQVVINRPGDISKPLMRAAMRGIMSDEARRRLRKVVPTPLFEHTLRHEAFGTVQELTRRPRIAEHGWVDAAAWRAHYEAWRSGAAPLRSDWWQALALEIWLRRFW